MHNYKYGDRPLTVSRATARGGKKEADAPIAEWKTVPTSKPPPAKKGSGGGDNKALDKTEKAGKSGNNKNNSNNKKSTTGTAKDTKKGPKSWDHWAGPG